MKNSAIMVGMILGLLIAQPPIPVPPPVPAPPMMSDALAGTIVAGVVAIMLALITNLGGTLAAWLKARDADLNATKAVAAGEDHAKILDKVSNAVDGQRTALLQEIVDLKKIIIAQAWRSQSPEVIVPGVAPSPARAPGQAQVPGPAPATEEGKVKVVVEGEKLPPPRIITG